MSLTPRAFGLKFALFLSLTVSTVFAQPDRTFEVSAAESREIRNFVRLLEEAHYNREAVDPSSYTSVIRGFMEDWDAHHLFFLKSDADTYIERYSDGLYWNISALGDVSAGFEIFKRYESRARDRAEWIFKRLEEDFDLESHDDYVVDRRELDWVATNEEADVLWEKRLRFELIQELLNEVEIAEAKEKLRKRYERMLKNLADIETHEVAEVFLTNIAQLYDPHSTYFSPDTYADFSIQMRLQLVGIGALLGMEDDECVIREIIPGGPADLDDRLEPNDKIIAVSQSPSGEGEAVELIGMKLRRIVDLIRGEKGTDVFLTIQPADDPDPASRKEIKITRDVVNLDSARARGAIFEVPDDEGGIKPIGVISLPAFYGPDPGATDGPQNSASGDVAILINQLQKQGIEGLVLDLRDNGGGLLSEAIHLTGLFIEKGPVVQVRSYYGDIKVDNDEDSTVRYAGPLAVLVSKYSASASEIVAGALQNYGRAVVLGDSSTHGKGTVQTVYEMRNLDPRLRQTDAKTGAAKFTIQKFYLPSGSSTQLNGVVPDIVLPSIDDVMESGERFLPQALVWDEIDTTQFDGTPLDAHILSPLQEASLARQNSLPEFDYLQRNIDWFTERQEQETVSLNLTERIEQRDTDKAFREAMKEERKTLREQNYVFTEFLLTPPEEEEAQSDEKVTPESDGLIESSEETIEVASTAPAGDSLNAEDIEAATEDEEEEPEPEGYAQLDIHLREAMRVLVDAVEISEQPQFAERRPLTARSTTGG
ncbi:MAG: carboxy terminal-processing peptidase [Synoicihabitans sp.]